MLLALLSVVACVQAQSPTTIHVSRGGDDGAAGTSGDTALATLDAARDRVRALREKGDRMLGPVRIVLAPGLYTLREPFDLTVRDSGTAAAPVTYAANEPGTVVISGGVKLGAWKEVELNGRRVWSTPVPEGVALAADGSPGFRSLWMNGTRRVWARYPNGGAFARVEAVPEKPAGDWTVGPRSFRFAQADAAAWASVGEGAEVTTFTRWIDSHLRVDRVEQGSQMARFKTPNMIALEASDLYKLEGSGALLDAPGEWWCDSAARVVYTIPKEGDVPEAESFVPRLTQLVRVKGDSAKGEYVEHVKFEGLTFAHARWWFAADQAEGKAVGFMQAAAGAPGAVVCEGARGLAFERCTIRGVESYGLELGRGCTDCRVTRCTVTDLGAGGIKIGETAIRAEKADQTARNRVEDCVISDGGHIHHQAVGVWIGQSAENTLSHNLIAEFDYTGISIGWTWGYGPSAAGGNIVEWNEIRNLGRRPGNAEPPLGDMGGIYTLGTQQGTVIRKNYFHDISGHTIAWGIYFDEGSTGIVAEENIVKRTSHGGFHQHYGKDNVVRRNLFVDGREAQVWRTRREEHNSFTFEDNVVVGAGTRWLAGDWSTGFVMKHNLHWRTDGAEIMFPDKRVFSAWQHAGNDAGSLVADPGLTWDTPTRPRIGVEGWAAPDLTGAGVRR